MANKKCKHNWHYVGTETFKQVMESSKQFATFICDICGETKTIEVNGYLNRVILNKDIRD